MATPNTEQAESRTNSVRSPHARLDSLVAIATGHINEQLMPLVARLVAAMLDVSEPWLDADSVYHRVKSANPLKNNSYAWFHLACAEIERGLRKGASLLAPARAPWLTPWSRRLRTMTTTATTTAWPTPPEFSSCLHLPPRGGATQRRPAAQGAPGWRQMLAQSPACLVA